MARDPRAWHIRLLDFFRCLLMLPPLYLVAWFPKARPEGRQKQLLIVSLDAIGDFVLWQDAAAALRRLYPEEQFRLTLLGNCLWTPLAEQLSGFDVIWPLDKRKYLFAPLYFIRTLLKVRGGAFDIAINPAYSREFKFGDLLVRASGAPRRIGSSGDLERMTLWQHKLADRWYTRLIPARSGPLMELERNADFVRGLGAPDFLARVPELSGAFPLPAGFSARDYFVVVPGAGLPARQWPLGHFADLAARIREQTGWTAIICGGTGDARLGAELAGEGGVGVQSWCGKTSLPELVAVLAGARLVVANETGAIHIAAAVSVPSVCITGGGHLGRFVPYRTEAPCGRPQPVAVSAELGCSGCGWVRCREARCTAVAPCIARISVAAVWSAVRNTICDQNETTTIAHKDRP